MVGLAEWTDEKEILFPEMTALIIGLLIIDKRVWNVKRWQIILLMTLGAAVGICIVRYSPLPYVVNLCAAFAFAGASLLISRATLIPLISACVLPVLLHTESIVYPIAVFSMSVSVVFVQIILEKCGIRNRMPKSVDRKPSKEDIIRWLILFCFVGAFGRIGRRHGLSLSHIAATHGDLCRNGKLQSRIQESPYTSISLSDYRSDFGYCTSNSWSLPSSSTGKYRCFNHCGYPVPHLRVDREILCSCRSTGVHSYAITQRESGLVTFRGFYRSCFIHNHCHGCLSKML